MPQISLVRGDITDQAVDAIVNAANPTLMGGGGVDGAIHARGGPTIIEECRQIRAERWPDGLPTGMAVATGAGDLPARWVIHTVGPIYSATEDRSHQLAVCHSGALRVADELGATSVAFPAISTGIFGYPIEKAAPVAVRAVLESTTGVEDVRFVLFDDASYQAFSAALENFHPRRAVADRSLTVAVTGPTGEIGRAVLRALDRNPEIGHVRGMARRPFDPLAEGLHQCEYVQGDILDSEAVEKLVTGADVVIHLAFLIWGSHEETRDVNLAGSRLVFERSIEAGVDRLVYTSSVAAYGFHEDNPDWLTEDIPARGTDAHYYSAQKAELEETLDQIASGSGTDVYVLRPCIVAGPSALALIKRIPYVQLSEKIPKGAKRLLGGLPLLRPVIPDPGVPFQLVHEDDVADAVVACALGHGEPGPYNLAAEGELSFKDLATALGWYSIPLPENAVEATVKVVSKFPYLPASASWLNAVSTPVLMDCTRAREKLGWQPRHDALETLAATIAGAREAGIIRPPRP